LDFARTTEPRVMSVNVNDLLDNLNLLVRHKLRNQNIALQKRLAPDLPLIMADPTQLEQAFLNIILNAVQAMPNGGSLIIETRCDAGSVVIQIADTGEGMTPEQRDRTFTSLLKSQKPGGTGIGLAIVRRVIETHRGSLQIDSRVGEGTQIRITLPT